MGCNQWWAAFTHLWKRSKSRAISSESRGKLHMQRLWVHWSTAAGWKVTAIPSLVLQVHHPDRHLGGQRRDDLSQRFRPGIHWASRWKNLDRGRKVTKAIFAVWRVCFAIAFVLVQTPLNFTTWTDPSLPDLRYPSGMTMVVSWRSAETRSCWLAAPGMERLCMMSLYMTLLRTPFRYVLHICVARTLQRELLG